MHNIKERLFPSKRERTIQRIAVTNYPHWHGKSLKLLNSNFFSLSVLVSQGSSDGFQLFLIGQARNLECKSFDGELFIVADYIQP